MILLTIVLFLILFLNVLSLPANWLIVCVFAVVLCTNASFTAVNFFVILALAIVGEILEGYLQIRISSKSGASRMGNFGGIVGSILGAIVGVSFFLGFGALLGALVGAWLGCYAVERMRNVDSHNAVRSAWGALKGRFLGFCIKMGLGMCMIVYGMNALSVKYIGTFEDINVRHEYEEGIDNSTRKNFLLKGEDTAISL